MEPDQEQTAPEADTSETSGSPAQTVRVPNVSPGAKSGLDHNVIGSDALTSPEDDDSDEPDGEPSEAELAGAGEAVNAETGETTDPGESLPPIEQTEGTLLVPAGLSGEELDAWVSGDAVEGDETENPERWAAYLERKQAAADLIDQHGGDDSGSGSDD